MMWKGNRDSLVCSSTEEMSFMEALVKHIAVQGFDNTENLDRLRRFRCPKHTDVYVPSSGTVAWGERERSGHETYHLQS